MTVGWGFNPFTGKLDATDAGGTITAAQEILLDNLPGDSKEPAGFPNRTDSSLAFDNSTKVFTIAPTGASFSFYSAGVRYTKSVAQTTDLDDLGGGISTNGLHFIYFDAAGDLQASKSAWTITAGLAMVAVVYWNGSAGAILDERHGLRDLEWHSWAHLTVGTRYETGGAIIRPSTANDLQIELSASTVWDEDLKQVSTAAQGKLCRLVRESSAGVFTWISGTDNAGYDTPVFWNAGTSKVQYNNGSYTLTDLTAVQYYAVWVYQTNDQDRPFWIYAPTLASPYVTLAAARNAPVPVSFIPEMKLLYRWIYRGDGEFQESQDYRTSGTLPGGGSSIVAASSVVFTPSGNIAATNAQAAIEELDTEKIPKVAVIVAQGSSFNTNTLDDITDNAKIINATAAITITLETYTDKPEGFQLGGVATGGIVTLAGTYSSKSSYTKVAQGDVFYILRKSDGWHVGGVTS